MAIPVPHYLRTYADLWAQGPSPTWRWRRRCATATMRAPVTIGVHTQCAEIAVSGDITVARMAQRLTRRP